MALEYQLCENCNQELSIFQKYKNSGTLKHLKANTKSGEKGKSVKIKEANSETSNTLAENLEEAKATTEKEHQKQKVKGPQKPFESFQNCLFTTFTACVPWCMMKQVYWKKDRKSEELFTITARRNSRTRVKMKFRDSRQTTEE